MKNMEFYSLLPQYLLHVTAVPHSESPSLIWSLIACNTFLVIAGIFFIVKLFRQKNVLKSGITFGVALAINYILIAVYGSVFDLLG
ncbi:hypothetical protein [Neobacillus niacini]|uniref:hypothetical protein n=1 Tax=Neobacillus niacini TaxID=86668 RepID=UPI00285A422D|nr:hypothetical protein [Neobacillus niacini]MDR7002976.1 hypothetical protein [Neobacillus niacini]